MPTIVSVLFLFGAFLVAGFLVILLLQFTDVELPEQLLTHPLFTIRHTWQFFMRRYDFLQDGFKKTRKSIFPFRILHHRVFALSGEEGRKVFFNGSFHLVQGYTILMGGAPRLEDINVDSEGGDPDSPEFIRRVTLMLRKERITELLPLLFDDVHAAMHSWGPVGQINPFQDLYDLVFLLTVRLAACRDLSDDRAAVSNLARNYFILEKSATPMAVLCPWLPTPARLAQAKALISMYMTLNKYVNIRRSSQPSNDAFDILIAQGDSNKSIIQFALSIIFVAVINTGAIVCWTFLFLGMHPEWKEKVIQEIRDLISKHTVSTSVEPLHKRLASLPLSAWEEQMPILECVLRETIRLTLAVTALRRNTTKDVAIADTVVRKGDFLTYCISEVHMDPKIYPEPTKFDPDRHSKKRDEGKKAVLGFLGWGAGRHPCTGVKYATLEMKWIITLILSEFEYEIVDQFGKCPRVLPLPDRNNMLQGRPSGDPCFMRYQRKVIA